MSEINNIVEVLGVFQLNKLSEDWVKSVWDSDFTEAENITEEVVEDIDSSTLVENLERLLSCLNHWIFDQVDEGLWSQLVENDVSLKALIAFLSYLLLSGHKKSADLTQKEIGILSGRVYCQLILVPGSGAFNIFHPELYEKTVDFLKWFTVLGASGNAKRKRNATPVKSGQARRNNKSRRKKQSVEASFDDDTEDISGSQEGQVEEDEAQELAPQEVARLRRHLHTLIVDMVTFLEKFSLRGSVSSAHHSVQVISPLTKHDAEMFDGNFEPSTPRMRQSIPVLAFKQDSTSECKQFLKEFRSQTVCLYDLDTFDKDIELNETNRQKALCLQELCSPLHGRVGSLMNATCKCLLPNLLMLVGDKSVQTVSKQLQVTQDHAVSFVCILMKQCGERGLVSVRTLIQHMCTKVTDRAEYRVRVAQSVVTIAKEMPYESYSKLVQWFYKLSKHSQINNRGFALEVVSALLGTPERMVTEEIPADLRLFTSHRFLLGILLDRCSDKAPTVRARAIGCFSQCLTTRDEHIAGTVKEIVTPQCSGRPNIQRLIKTPGAPVRATESAITVDESSGRSEVTIAQQTVEGSTATQYSAEGGAKDKDAHLHRVNLTPGFDPNLSDSEGVFSMLRRRAKDDKVNVRKSAIQALEAAIRFEAPNYTRQNVEVLKEHCRDPGLSVRKQALQSLTDLLTNYPKDKFMQSNWLLAALPLVIDRETTLSEKCMEVLEELVLNNIVLYVRSKSESHELAWNLLDIIAKPASVDQRRYLQKVCHHWSRQGKIKSSLITALQSHIGTSNNSAAWMLLAEIASAAPKLNQDFLLNYWQNQAQQETCSVTMNRVLTVMKCVAKHLPTDDRQKLITELRARLLRFDSPPELISVSVNTLSKLCSEHAKATNDVGLVNDWSSELLKACDEYLSRVVLEHDGSMSSEEKIVCHLFTLGEMVQLCPGKVPKRVFLLVQSMIAAPCITSPPANQSQHGLQNEENKSHHQNDQNQSDQTSPTSAKDKSGDLSSSSQMSQGSGDSQASQPLTQFRGCVMSNRVRAFAFITLGKLCLQNEGLAKKCIAALARELEICQDPAIRNNVMIIMCDLCVRYTTIANHYISNIASCLRDPSPLVRKQTLTLITRLLQEDFLKWKGALFYRFLSALLDSCEEIKKFGEFCLLHMLIQRHPNMFFQHFMECVFHFNDYKEHSVYNRFSQSEKDRELFSMKGDKNARQRLTLYKFLLENMPDDHRFQLQSKLVQEVLGGVVDGILPINNDTTDILKDVLTVLSCKEIKLSSLKVHPSEDVAGDEQEMVAVVAATAKKTIITQVLKKNVIENIVPIVVSLKHMMEKERSKLLKELLLYLRELMKDYKNEVKEILSADRQLATEIEFDLRKFEEQQLEAARQRSAPSSAQSTPAPGAAKSPVPGTNLMSPPPSTGGSARPQGSPRTPALKSSIGSAKSSMQKGSPSVRIAPNRNTPAKQAPLSTLALLNSARRLMSQPRTSSVDTEDGKEDEESPPPGVTPIQRKRGNNSRAISTPSGSMINITFHGEANMTFMPPSPIQETSVDHRLYDSDSSVALDGDNPDKENENVLIMKSPLAGQPKARVWNVTSPAPRRGRNIVEETDDAEAESVDQRSNKGQNKDEPENNGKTTQKKDTSKTKRGRTILSDQIKDNKDLGSEEQTDQTVRRGKRKLKK